MSQGLTVQYRVHFGSGRNSRKELRHGRQPLAAAEPGRVPRVSRMMALAIRLEGLMRSGMIASRAELARLGHVQRSRITQIMNLLYLAPDIQEAVLFLPETKRGRDPFQERQLRRIACVAEWKKQRKLWRELVIQT